MNNYLLQGIARGLAAYREIGRYERLLQGGLLGVTQRRCLRSQEGLGAGRSTYGCAGGKTGRSADRLICHCAHASSGRSIHQAPRKPADRSPNRSSHRHAYSSAYRVVRLGVDQKPNLLAHQVAGRGLRRHAKGSAHRAADRSPDPSASRHPSGCADRPAWRLTSPDASKSRGRPARLSPNKQVHWMPDQRRGQPAYQYLGLKPDRPAHAPASLHALRPTSRCCRKNANLPAS